MKNKTIKTLKALKKVLKKTLPEKISQVLQSYENFSQQNEPEDAKSFCAYHTALKSAISHVDTLLKLAKWMNEDNQKFEIGADLKETEAAFRFIKEAQNLRMLEENNFDDD